MSLDKLICAECGGKLETYKDKNGFTLVEPCDSCISMAKDTEYLNCIEALGDKK